MQEDEAHDLSVVVPLDLSSNGSLAPVAAPAVFFVRSASSALSSKESSMVNTL